MVNSDHTAIEGTYKSTGKTNIETAIIKMKTKMIEAWRYTRALSKWIKAGRPVRSEDAILGIYTTYCQECECLDRHPDRCKLCGCHVGTIKSPLRNKIAMGTEHCPDAKW